jgi:imidazolonepropionase-like amidohydrolase
MQGSKPNRARVASRMAGLLIGLVISVPSSSVAAAVAARPGAGVGLRDVTPTLTAYTNARIVTRPGRVIESGMVVVSDGVIRTVRSGGQPPAGAHVVDLSGRTLYPGFIELVAHFGLPEDVDPVGPRHPMSAVRAERSPVAVFEPDADAAAGLRDLGFTAALITYEDGIFRGRGAVVALADVDADDSAAGDVIIAEQVGQHVTLAPNPFNFGQPEPPAYPSALMGAIALVRQTFYDADWYGRANSYFDRNHQGERPQYNPALAAMAGAAEGSDRVFLTTTDELDIPRAFAIRDEFELSMVVIGSGYEYRVADALRGETVVIPLDFPDAPQVDDPDRALDVSLEQLSHWELAPGNAVTLQEAGAALAITSNADQDGFWGDLRAAVAAGLSADSALAALTTAPALLAGVADELGTIAEGKLAHFIIADGDLFEDGSIQAVVVDGTEYRNDSWPADEPLGSWSISYQGVTGPSTLNITGGPGRYELDAGGDAAIRVQGTTISAFIAADRFGAGAGDGYARLAAALAGDQLTGTGALPDGSRFSFLAQRAESADDDADPDGDDDAQAAGDDARPSRRFDGYPAGAYAMAGPPERPEALLITNATVWTSADAGILDDTDILVRDGRIAAIGTDLEAPSDAMVIDAAGRHVTPGLIDAHSHTGISGGTNEPTDSVTVEVRIRDVIDPTDVGYYRELAGGLTAANIMHGSANAMGGQVQTVKLRWGEDAAGLIQEDAQQAVKFALGENVKQSNWGDDYVTRYPQTRMGVPEIMMDTFEAAREYGAAMDRRGGPPVRRDLRLDAALEILNGERAIHIHSYRQDEILRFAQLAADLELNVAAFQHVLEGYKVAPEIAAIGAGASTFSDWWAYKYEVVDAIPYNGALMYEQGLTVTFNSDSSELARRMNTEAAKAVRYGGVPRADALNFVTINAAIQLGIDHRTGSIEVGKDADLVIWSGDPLSTYSIAEQTWIEGRRYFDLDTDREMREAIRSERARLIAAALPDRLAELSVELPEADGEGEPEDDPAHSRVFACGDYQRGIYGDGRSTHACAQEVLP